MLILAIQDVTGNEKSSKAVVTIYDIFGIAPQTIQGADLLAAALDALVLMPDFFKGAGKKNEWVGEGMFIRIQEPT